MPKKYHPRSAEKQVAPLFVHVVAFYRKQQDFLSRFVDYEDQKFERNINVTLVAGLEKKKSPFLKRAMQRLKLSKPTPHPQVTLREIPAHHIEALHPTLTISQELPTWNYPSLVFDADARFIGYWPFDIGSDKYDFGQKVDEGKFGYERARASWPLEDDEASVDDYSRAQDITKRLAVFRPKNTIEATIEKMLEISQRIADMKSEGGAKEIETGYYNEDAEVVQRLVDNGKMQLYRKEERYLKHNECHIRAKIHNIKYVSYTKKQGPIAIFQAVILADKINALKKEILAEHEEAQRRGAIGARLAALIRFEEDNYQELQNKIKAIESKILAYRENLESEMAENFDNSDLDESMQRKAARYKEFKPTLQNKKIWLENNIAKLEEDLENLRKIRPTTKEDILEKLQVLTKLSVYSLDMDETFLQESVRSLKAKIVEDINLGRDLDNLVFMGYGEFEDGHFDETFFKATKDGQKEALFHHNFDASATLVDALIAKSRLAVIKKIFEVTLDKDEAIDAICRHNLISRAITSGGQEIFDYFWTKLSQKEESLAKLIPNLIQTIKRAIEHNNEKALGQLTQKFKKEVQEYLPTFLEHALQNNRIAVAQSLLTLFDEKNFGEIVNKSADNNIFHLMARFCKEEGAEMQEVLLRMASEIYGNLSKINRNFSGEKSEVVSLSIARIFLFTPQARENLNPLEIAIKSGNLTMTKFFLSKFEELSLGFDCNKIFNLACESKMPAMLEFLLDLPSFAENKINYAAELLNFAVENNNEELADFAVKKCDLNLFKTKYVVDGEEVNAFKHAILRGNPEMLRSLLRLAKRRSSEVPSPEIGVDDYINLSSFVSDKIPSSIARGAPELESGEAGRRMIKIITVAMLDREGRSLRASASSTSC